MRKIVFPGVRPEEKIGIISPICHDRRYREGDELFSETSNGSELYIIRKGIVAIEVALPNRADKRSERLTTATSGMIVGDLALVDGSPRTKTFKENQLDL